MREWAEQLHKGIAGRTLQLLFLVAWTTELVVVIIDKSAIINPYESYIFRATFALFSVCMAAELPCCQRRERVLLVLFLLLGFVSWRISGRNELLRTFVMVAACRGRNIRRVMKYTLYVTLAGCLVLVALSLTGVMGTVSITQEYGHGVETRYTLGLGHPNALHCMAMMLILLALYLYADQLRAWGYAAFFIFNLLLYFLTRSNAGFVVTGLGIVLSFLFHYSRRCREGGLLYVLPEAALMGGLVLTLIGCIFSPYRYPLIEKIDYVMTGRFGSMWGTTFHEGTLSTWRWFGSRMNQSYFDLGFARLVYWYGVIPAAVVLVVLFLLLRYLRRKRAAAAFILLITCAIYTVPEAHLVSVYLGRNYCLLLAGLYLPEILAGTTPEPDPDPGRQDTRRQKRG